jgi:hypothetical protein
METPNEIVAALIKASDEVPLLTAEEVIASILGQFLSRAEENLSGALSSTRLNTLRERSLFLMHSLPLGGLAMTFGDLEHAREMLEASLPDGAWVSELKKTEVHTDEDMLFVTIAWGDRPELTEPSE